MDTNHQAQQYLTFSLGQEMYAIGTRMVKEIIGYGHLTAVPLAPGSIRGVINLRGAVVPVIDLAARFGRGQAVPGRRTSIVILEVRAGEEQEVIGMVVDAVSEVLEIAPAQIEAAPAFGVPVRADFIQGMARLGTRFVVLLDVDRVFSVDELAAGVSPAALAAA